MTVLRKPVTWDEAKKQLGDSSFMESLLRYNRDQLDDVLLKKINRFTTNPDFDPEVICMLALAFLKSSVPRKSGPKHGKRSSFVHVVHVVCSPNHPGPAVDAAGILV